ncbi:MAG: hypothetical protein IJV13_02645 [Prevotella sp.]|nr:hypothetical protein [Prevotella sp.]
MDTGITTIATLQGDWTEESAVKAVNEYKGDLSNVDFVFGQNDRMAMGARRAIEAQTSHPSLREGHGVGSYCGIDGPVELLRTARLNRGYQLLLTSALRVVALYGHHVNLRARSDYRNRGR